MSQDLNKQSLEEAIAYLSKTDPDFRKVIKKRNKQIILFKRTSGFEGLINLIVEQQLSVASAAAIFKRLKESIVPFSPKKFSLLEKDIFKLAGLSQQKIDYCKGISEACLSKALDFKVLETMTNIEVEKELVKLKGVGQWTAQCYLLGCMSRIDAWPSSDLGLQVAIKKLKNLKVRPEKLTIEKIAEPWRPFRSVAALILWSTHDK